MRDRWRGVLAGVAATAALGPGLAACSSSDGDARTSSPSEPPSTTPSGSPGGSTYDSPTCVQVRAGIDAFNSRAYDETVDHFKRAVPLARQAASADGAGVKERLLLRAVRYYAALPADDYPDAAATSSTFARWKAVTLGLCESAGQDVPEQTPSDPGQEA